jgi:hypothetical protein
MIPIEFNQLRRITAANSEERRKLLVKSQDNRRRMGKLVQEARLEKKYSQRQAEAYLKSIGFDTPMNLRGIEAGGKSALHSEGTIAKFFYALNTAPINTDILKRGRKPKANQS